MPLKERRHAKRYDVELPLIVRWTEGSKRREAHTVTEDISSGGVYFLLPEGIPEGTAVEVEMMVPSHITRGAPTKVICQGRIRRCELKAGERAGMGTAIEKYEFLAESEDAA